MLNPRLLLTIVGVLAIMAMFYQTYQTGYQNGQNQANLECQNAQVTAINRVIQQTNKINKENAQIEESYWQEQIDAKPKIKLLEKRIIQYVQTTKPGRCDLDDNELHILTDLTRIVNGNPKSTN